MKKILILIVIFFVTGCTDTNFYKTSELDNITKVANISDNLYLYERNVDVENQYRRYYYVGDENQKVYRELVTFFGFGSDEFNINDYTYNFIGVNGLVDENTRCINLGIEVEIIDADGSVVYHRLEEGDNIYISYCLKDGKPYRENAIE